MVEHVLVDIALGDLMEMGVDTDQSLQNFEWFGAYSRIVLPFLLTRLILFVGILSFGTCSGTAGVLQGVLCFSYFL